MRPRLPLILLGASAALTLLGGGLLAVALATDIGTGGPYGPLVHVYPLCLFPGVLLLLDTFWLARRRIDPDRAATLALAGAVLSIPLAFAGLWAGFVLAVIAAATLFLPAASPVGADVARAPRRGVDRWLPPLGVSVAVLVGIVVLCPQTIGASVISTVDLVNDPVANDVQAVFVGGTGGSSLSYSVNAVAQGTNCGLGYAYLVNGYANDSGEVYWFQVGLAYDWGGGSLSSSGWKMLYEVFDPAGDSVDPSSPGAGTASLSGPVHDGDTVDLSLTVSSQGVTMAASDPGTHATASELYAQSGTAAFGGGIPPQYGGYFTGLMTECYSSSGAGPSLAPVAYSDQGAGQSTGGVFVDEIDYSWGRLPYLPSVGLAPEHSAWTSLLVPTTNSFQAYGLTLVYNSTGFATGSTR